MMISLTSTVPATVPSLFHNSVPFSSVNAEKYKVPLMLIMLEISDAPIPVRISFTSVAPVPFGADFHSSSPLTPLSARKKTLLSACTKLRGPEFFVPRKISFTTAVFVVRSCRQSSLPFTPSLAV